VGPLTGKVAFVTGGARGQGRSHAIRLARDGADLIVIDICGKVDSVTCSPPTTLEDLAETQRLVEEAGARIVTSQADVRDINALTTAVDRGVALLGRLDIVVANAGILTFGSKTHEVDAQAWQEMMDVNLTGVWHTYKAAAKHLIESGPGGSVIITSSLAGFKGLGNAAAYVATKHGVVGIMKVLANELGPYGIRVNTIHPNAVNTPMIQNDEMFKLFRPDLEDPKSADAAPAFARMNPMGIDWVEPMQVSNVVAWLASDESRYVTGAQIPVDAGASVH
jgi:SDR family mycofactocin-dependent oxidoreductase